MEKIAVIVGLLTGILAEYQERKLIGQLNKFFHFDYNLFLVHSSTDLNRFINNNHQTYTPQSLFIYESVDNITLRHELQSKNPFLIVASEVSDYNSNVKLLSKVLEMQRKKLDMKIAIFSPTKTTDDLQNLFEWCWKNRIVYIFAATTGLISSIFTYNPFGKFVVKCNR